MLADLCADPGIFARGVQARLPENNSDNVFFFFFVLNFYNFTVAYQCFFFKENYNFTSFRGGGGGVVSNIFQESPTYSRGSNFFQGGGEAGGPNANSRNP